MNPLKKLQATHHPMQERQYAWHARCSIATCRLRAGALSTPRRTIMITTPATNATPNDDDLTDTPDIPPPERDDRHDDLPDLPDPTEVGEDG
ncbi:hypothetical protein LGM46_07060 [Burkholderia arboris]|uniref:hypothetical protein n=1 Tax=Burkholderia arboris TaxID=488730 RepID=UPI001CF224E0|nr:hypothetical protein [Burkholderia arboris]MCA8032736.1 hypothetical protein [Burkholderia arboris]